jgi:hypothetical protein
MEHDDVVVRAQLFDGDVKVGKCQAVQGGAGLDRLRIEAEIGDHTVMVEELRRSRRG